MVWAILCCAVLQWTIMSMLHLYHRFCRQNLIIIRKCTPHLLFCLLLPVADRKAKLVEESQVLAARSKRAQTSKGIRFYYVVDYISQELSQPSFYAALVSCHATSHSRPATLKSFILSTIFQSLTSIHLPSTLSPSFHQACTTRDTD